MSRRAPYLGITAGAALLLGAPSAAFAVTGTLDKPCYSHLVAQSTQPIIITLTGGTPGAGFVAAATAPGQGLGSQGSSSGNFDAAGNAVTQITDVFPPSGSINAIPGEPVAITVKDFGLPAPPADQPIGTALITNLTMDVARTPRKIRLKRKITVSGTPFASQAMYGFIVKGTNPKILRRISLGTADPCGYVTAKGIVAPKSFKTGKYRFYVNAGPTLNKPLAVYRSFTISRSVF